MIDMILRFDCTIRSVRDKLMEDYKGRLRASESFRGDLLDLKPFDCPGWYSFAVCIDDLGDSAIALDFLSSYREDQIFKTSCIKTA